jgi:hypothetical protein
MAHPRVYADFQNLDNLNRLRLTCAGTVEDLSRQGIRLQEGLVLTFYMDDADDLGRPDELRADGIVQHNQEEDCWVAAIDWSAIRHASEDKTADGSRSGHHVASVQPDHCAIPSSAKAPSG